MLNVCSFHHYSVNSSIAVKQTISNFVAWNKQERSFIITIFHGSEGWLASAGWLPLSLSFSYRQTRTELESSQKPWCLVVDSGYRLRPQWGLSAGTSVCDLSVWPGFPHSTVNGVQEHVPQRKPWRSCTAVYHCVTRGHFYCVQFIRSDLSSPLIFQGLMGRMWKICGHVLRSHSLWGQDPNPASFLNHYNISA